VPDNGRVTDQPPQDVDAATEAVAVPTADDVASTAPAPDDVVAATRAEREKRRLRTTVRDMVLSMAVVSAAVVLLVAPWNWSTPDPVKVVDPAPVVASAREMLPWPVYAPAGLPSTWRCTSARLETADDGQTIVHLGYLSPVDQYVGVEQSATKITSFVRDMTLAGTEQGTATVAGTSWTRYVTPDEKHRSLVRTQDDVTYVVTGTGDWPEIESFTATLRAG